MIEKIKKNRLLFFLAISIFLVLFVLLFRIVHAYFAIDMNEVLTKVNMTTNDVDDFKFIQGDTLVLQIKNANEEAKNVTSLNKVYLKANEKTKKANYHYYAYLDVFENNFVYTTEDQMPEVLLSVWDGRTQREITLLDDLKYCTINGISGFDVTTFRGKLKITDDAIIASNSDRDATIHEYVVTLSYLNLDSNQIENVGSSMKANLLFQAKPITSDS